MDNAFKVRTFKEVITDKIISRSRERFWEISSRKANFRLSELQLIVRKQLFVTMSPLPMHQACAIGKNRSVIK